MENKQSLPTPAPSQQENSSQPQLSNINRRHALKMIGSALAVGAAAYNGLGSAHAEQHNPLSPKIDLLQSNKPEPVEVSEAERLLRVGHLSRVLGDFLDPKGVSEVKDMDYFNEKDMKVKTTTEDGAKIYYFYGKKGEKEIKFATFVEDGDRGAQEVNILTDITGDERLEELAGKANSLLNTKLDFRQGGFVATEDIPADQEAEMVQTTIMHADFPKGVVPLQESDTGRPISIEKKVMVHPAGFIRLIQEKSFTFGNPESKPV